MSANRLVVTQPLVLFLYKSALNRQNITGGVHMVEQNELEHQIEMERKLFEQKEYQDLVKKVKPKVPLLRNVIGAFLVGGTICLIGQIILGGFIAGGLTQRAAIGATAAVMIFLGSLMTGLGIYDNLAKFAGAGSIVPITGFANSIVAPALEFKSEGYVFGLSSKMFVVAGPVLTFGFIASVTIGLIYYFLP
jgi:stage V sporulation protein AC